MPPEMTWRGRFAASETQTVFRHPSRVGDGQEPRWKCLMIPVAGMRSLAKSERRDQNLA